MSIYNHVLTMRIQSQSFDRQEQIVMNKTTRTIPPVLTVELLAQAIDRAVTDPVMRQQASNLGAKIQVEDGIATAVMAIESIYPCNRSSFA